jgi:pilus assembly protein CpaC
MTNNCKKTGVSRIAQLLLGIIMVLLGGTSAPAHAAKGDFETPSPDKGVHIALGKAKVVELDSDIADLMLADPSVANVRMINANRIYIVGSEIGDTNLVALDEQGEVVARKDIHVSLNLGRLRDKVAGMYPDSDVDIKALGEQVIIDGTVENADRAARISRVVASYVGEKIDQEGTVDEIVENMLKVRSGQQVMLRVRVVEARRDVLREIGVGPSFNNTIFDTLTPNDVVGTFNSFADTGLTADAFAEAEAFVDSGIEGVGFMGLFIRALEQKNMLNVLSEPNLTAISGEEAGFLAGGEFPIPVGADDGEIEIEFKQFGVSLNFRPEVLSPDRINLQLETEVSSLNPGAGITTTGINVPGLDVRRASTTVELNSGGSLMIAGLLESESVNNLSGLPGMSNSPVLSKLAGSESFQRDETELVVIITPVLVDGMKSFDEAEKIDHVPETPPGEKPLEKAFKRNISAAYDDAGDIVNNKESRQVGYILE